MLPIWKIRFRTSDSILGNGQNFLRIFPSLVEAASFASMKRNADDLAPAADANLWKNNSEFFANGTNGQWQDRWSKENLQRLDALSHEYSSDYMEWLLESKN